MSDSSPITWRDLGRWSAVLAMVVAVSFWFAKIDMAIASVQSDVTEIKVGLKSHVNLPAHPVAGVRLDSLERKVR